MNCFIFPAAMEVALPDIFASMLLKKSTLMSNQINHVLFHGFVSQVSIGKDDDLATKHYPKQIKSIPLL